MIHVALGRTTYDPIFLEKTQLKLKENVILYVLSSETNKIQKFEPSGLSLEITAERSKVFFFFR